MSNFYYWARCKVYQKHLVWTSQKSGQTSQKMIESTGIDTQFVMKKISAFIETAWNGQHALFQYLLIIACAYGLFFWLQASPALADPDSFYHAKIGIFLSRGTILHEFPWLHYTTLAETFVDHHFLYHIFLVPFVSLFPDPLAGLKFSVVVIGTAVFTLLFWFLKSAKVPFAFLLTLVLLTAGPYLFRANLAKAPILSMAVLVLGLLFLFRKKPLPLFFLSFFYVWMYAGWPLLFGVMALFLLIDTTIRWAKRVSAHETFRRLLFHKENIRLFCSVTFGLLLGLVVNPYFPDNIFFTWQQAVKIGLINYQNIIGVGGEWYPYKIFDLVGGLNVLFLALSAGVILFLATFPRQTPQSMTLFLLTTAFFLLTLKSKRNIEYFAPFAVLFSGFSIRDAFVAWGITPARLFQTVPPLLLQKVTYVLLAGYFAMMIPLSVFKEIQNTKRDLSGGSSFTEFQDASQWLQTHTKKGSIVLHSDWDESPILFYHNDWNEYIVGLDPTFMYEYNKDLYWKWVNVTTGKAGDDLVSIIKDNLRAQYVIVSQDHDAMDKQFTTNTSFEKVYEDKDAKIYQVL